MTKRAGYGIVGGENSVTKTPRLSYEPSTGFVLLSDGCSRQVVLRAEKNMQLYLYWKKGDQEVPVYLDELVEAVRKATEIAPEP